jgi:hypothetical protein
MLTNEIEIFVAFSSRRNDFKGHKPNDLLKKVVENASYEVMSNYVVIFNQKYESFSKTKTLNASPRS